jgi:hypothetical protein
MELWNIIDDKLIYAFKNVLHGKESSSIKTLI